MAAASCPVSSEGRVKSMKDGIHPSGYILRENRKTNADRIRSMTDTELRLFICEIADCKRCPCHDMCIEYGMGTGIQKWLQSEVEE